MKTTTTTKILIATCMLVLVWHLKIATSAQTRLAGLFMAKPGQPGYVWSDIGNADSRFFWDVSEVKWKTGLLHPEYNVISAEKHDDWLPQPGYTFINKSKNLTVVWQAALLHPDFMALSDKNEGDWVPVAGYKLVHKDGELIDADWDPNKRYDDLKVISQSQQDHYKPFPGYQLIEPGKSLKVAWIPGMVNSDNPALMAGSQEGSWVVANRQSPLYRSARSGNTFGKRLTRRMAVRASDRFVDRVFGY